MAKITISSISIENIGPFRDRQTLDFRVTNGRPIILVTALNGSGKTTLLTMLQIGLYGQKAFGDLRKSEYERLLLGLQRKDVAGNAIVEIGVAVEVGSSRRHLLLHREWSRETDGLSEELSIFTNGSKDFALSQAWEEFIAAILPAELVQLFLFDGEKIEALANPERLPDLLKRAIEVFLGIGGIEALGNDLKALERRAALKNKSTSTEFETARNSISSWEAQANELEKQLQILAQEQAAARNIAEQAQIALDKFTSEAQGRGLKAYEQAAAIRNAVVVGKQNAEAARANLAESMSDPTLPIAWLENLWPKYRDIWEQDQNLRHAEILGEELKKRDNRVVLALRGALPESAIDILRKTLADDLHLYNYARPVADFTLQDAPPNDIERQLHDATARLVKEMQNLQKAQNGLDKAEQNIGQILAEEQMVGVLNTLQERSKAVALAETHLTVITQHMEEVKKHLAHIRGKLNIAYDRLNAEFLDHSLETKGLSASVRARKTLAAFKVRLLASKAQWLSEMITIEFRNLLRKRNFITKVMVNPDTYSVSIKDGKHQELPMDRLSAGERQLLAISVLSALIKERKGRFPVVVDTPLARLDQQHRSTLIKRFFATVSHQVVVLSTDQEVDGLAYDALKPFVNAEFSLDFDDLTGCTTVRRLAPEEVN